MSEAAQVVDPVVELNLRILKLENRLQRERVARLEAEAIAERGLSERYHQLVLLEMIATKANQSASVDETLRFAVEAICQHVGCHFGGIYLLADGDVPRLVPTRLWHADDPDGLGQFVASRTMFHAGEGLPGRVLETGKAVWIADFPQDPGCPRASTAKACDLHAAFAFPVLVGNDIVAVMEFFFGDILEPNESLLGVMGQIGTQLGRVIERKRAEDQLIYDASHDPLTGLPNRLLFSDRLDRAVAAHRRRPATGFAVLFIDLDRFKLVNDSLGHAAGDALLIEIAGRFSSVLAKAAECGEVDVLPTLARLGGDEFTVLMEELSSTAISIEIAKRLQDALRYPITLDGQDIYTSASIGIATSETEYECPADVLRDADLAMYRAKSDGRARVAVFDQSLHEIAMRRLSLESDLRGALRKREFELHYQPIFALESRGIVGFEALVRWRRGDELVPPSEFIGVAEETGLIVYLGNWVMREAFATAKAWQDEHPRPKPLTMSVNVSPRQFHQTDFFEQVVSALEDTGVRPDTICLEITESVTIKDPERTFQLLQRLREVGVRVSIDDFGTGYSSLSYLHQLPLDALKIDRSFVNALHQRSGGRELIQTILDLAKNLRIEVVAEGAETEGHVDQLRQMGCGFAQGYYFARPLDGESTSQLIRSLID
ncbi:EAL domain-containing protein [Mesorhizobium sp. CC13]|uniref:EAL domain-containing protein n=1 Tax=Mesorhizobium sp. CC13 TaxID=3029194 RepID=UPI0032632C9B